MLTMSVSQHAWTQVYESLDSDQDMSAILKTVDRSNEHDLSNPVDFEVSSKHPSGSIEKQMVGRGTQ